MEDLPVLFFISDSTSIQEWNPSHGKRLISVIKRLADEHSMDFEDSSFFIQSISV